MWVLKKMKYTLEVVYSFILCNMRLVFTLVDLYVLLNFIMILLGMTCLKLVNIWMLSKMGSKPSQCIKVMKYSEATSSINLKITLIERLPLCPSSRSDILDKRCLPNRFDMLERQKDSRMLDICTELKLVPRRFYQFATWQMETARFSEMLVPIYQFTLCHIPADAFSFHYSALKN